MRSAIVSGSAVGLLVAAGIGWVMGARRQFEERFRRLFDLATDPHFLVIDGKVRECNHSAIRVLGLSSKDELLEGDVTRFWPEHQPNGRLTSEAVAELVSAARLGRTARAEFVKRDINGNELPVEVGVTALAGEERSALLVVWRDLRETKTTQARLRKSESRYRELVENLHQIIYQTDIKGNFVYVNPAWQRVTGYTVAGTIGEHFAQFVNKEDLPMLEDQHAAELAGDVDVVHFEVRLRSRTGRWRHAAGSCRPLRDERGEVIGTTGMLSDETDYLQAQEDLVAAKEAAEAADRAKGEFLAVMSHEIRTPLNGVLGFASLLRETSLDSNQKEYLQTISGCGDSLLTLIDDILDFSRMESGRLELEDLPFHLRNCVEGVVDIHAHRANEKDVELIVDLSDDFPAQVSGDVIRVKQVLSNLVGNAIKFTDAGHVRLRGWISARDGEEVELKFRVEDTGSGIPAEQLEKLFRPFVQVDASTSRRFGGTGLGLAICRRLAEAMSGRIAVESEFGKGTTVEFTLNQREVEAPAPPPDWTGRTVLVVEQNEECRHSLAEALRRSGAAAIEAGNPDEALAVFDGESVVDLVAVGSMEARSDEPGALVIARRARGVDIPVMVMSPLTGSGARVPRDLPGECCRLAKPIHWTSLRAMLDRVFSVNEECAPGECGQRPIDVPSVANARSDAAILLVEDNEVNTKLMLRILANLGYSADHAGDGEACLRQCERRKYDVILMDIQLPGMDGITATDRLREQGCESAVIALTAHAMPEDRERCLAAGMAEYLTKPVQLPRLREVLGEFVVAHSDPANGSGPTTLA
ncbi:MAG: response regulator [Chthoniobacterales bacterium]